MHAFMRVVRHWCAAARFRERGGSRWGGGRRVPGTGRLDGGPNRTCMHLVSRKPKPLCGPMPMACLLSSTHKRSQEFEMLVLDVKEQTACSAPFHEE